MTFKYFTAGNLVVVFSAFLIPVIAGISRDQRPGKKAKQAGRHGPFIPAVSAFHQPAGAFRHILYQAHLYNRPRPGYRGRAFCPAIGRVFMLGLIQAAVLLHTGAFFRVPVHKAVFKPRDRLQHRQAPGAAVMDNAADVDKIAFYGQIKRTMRYLSGPVSFQTLA